MKLAISNLAWEKKDNGNLIKYLQTQGINLLEYTPYKLFLFSDFTQMTHYYRTSRPNIERLSKTCFFNRNNIIQTSYCFFT